MHEDDSDVLVALIEQRWTSPRKVQLRTEFLASCAKQRSSARGITALPSLAAELHAHQINTARKVLDDPVGRFLLADEVGLGKTIEAAIVIRQALIDNPHLTVRVLMPPQLELQWREELARKAFVGGSDSDFPDADVLIHRFDEERAWKGGPDGLLVIDEAHQVATWAADEDGLRRTRYLRARKLSGRADRVLLLSATPSLHAPRTFLALLALLDPDRYSPTPASLPAFEQRLAQRSEIATALGAIDPDDPAEIVVDALEDLAKVLRRTPSDAKLVRRVATNIAGEGMVRPEEVSVIITLVRERHRIDARMLRTRRAGVRRDFSMRGRFRGESIVTESAAMCDADEWFDNWRIALAADADDMGADRQHLAPLVNLFASVAMAAPGLLSDLAAFRRNPQHVGAQRSLGITAAELPRFEHTRVAVGAREAIELDRVPHVGGALPAEVVHELVRQLAVSCQAGDKVVVMTSFNRVAVQLYDATHHLLGSSAACLYLKASSKKVNNDHLARFLDHADPCRILICDVAAEEGLNLQDADCLILADLPLSPNSLEQKIGRLDRHATGSATNKGPVEVRVLDTGAGTELRAAIDMLLDDSLHIFAESTAALQLTIAEHVPLLLEALLDDGARGVRSYLPALEGAVKAGMRELAHAELLDADPLDDVAYEIVARVEEADHDERWEATAESARRLVLTDTNRQSSRGGSDTDLEHLKALAQQPMEFARERVLSDPGRRLARVGDPLIDGCEYELQNRPERVCAIRRTAEERLARAESGFVFSFRSIARSPSGAAEVRAVVARRVAAVLPERLIEIAVSADGVVLADDDRLARILLRQVDFRDRVLDSIDPSDLTGLGARDWDLACEQAAALARTAAIERLGTDPGALLGDLAERARGVVRRFSRRERRRQPNEPPRTSSSLRSRLRSHAPTSVLRAYGS